MSLVVRVEVRPRWPLRLPGAGLDGVARRRGGILERLVHVGGEAVVVSAAQPSRDRLVIAGRGETRAACEEGIERMRFALGADDDLEPFHRRFRDDPVIGRVLRAAPWVRPARRPEPFEALAWGVCEQLIEYVRAAAIQRRIVGRLGRGCPESGLRDLPTAADLAGVAPAVLESFDLSAGRAVTLVAVAREVASGRVDLHAGRPEAGWRRLRALPGVGAWTVEVLGLHGQGRLDQLPAGDVGLRKVVGRLVSGDPRGRVETEAVREFFARYAPYEGLAGTYALRFGAARLGRPTRPRPGGTRW
ncbi:MAG: DNA-3-methyladenine glycosylase [Solirubrobacteraceae bacterium]|nr:DNA-3-methyladenine glycosylase [Solirubrobacteraceae bacterium]